MCKLTFPKKRTKPLDFQRTHSSIALLRQMSARERSLAVVRPLPINANSTPAGV